MKISGDISQLTTASVRNERGFEVGAYLNVSSRVHGYGLHVWTMASSLGCPVAIERHDGEVGLLTFASVGFAASYVAEFLPKGLEWLCRGDEVAVEVAKIVRAQAAEQANGLLPGTPEYDAAVLRDSTQGRR